MRRAWVLAAMLGALGCTAPRPLDSECALNSECAAGLVCVARACRVQCRQTRDCTAGFTCVGAGVCVAPQTSVPCDRASDCLDSERCVERTCRAACTTAMECPDGAACTDGACATPSLTPPSSDAGEPTSGMCTRGRVPCAMTCTDLRSDAQNCGVCGRACGSGEICVAGQCDCVAPRATCGSDCSDLQTDARHCADCATSCAAEEACVAGRCATTYSTCATPLDVPIVPGEPSTVRIEPAGADGAPSCGADLDAYVRIRLTQPEVVAVFSEDRFFTRVGYLPDGCGGRAICEQGDMGYAVRALPAGEHVFVIDRNTPAQVRIEHLPVPDLAAVRPMPEGDIALSGSTVGLPPYGSCGSGPAALFYYATSFAQFRPLRLGTCAGTSFDSTLSVVTLRGTVACSTDAMACGTPAGGSIGVTLNELGLSNHLGLFVVSGQSATDRGTFALEGELRP